MNEPFEPETVAAVTALIKLIADPEGCARRLAELRQLTATAKAAQTKLDSDRAQYSQQLERDAAAMTAREDKLRRGEIEVASLRAQLLEGAKIRETYYLNSNLNPGGRSHSGLARKAE